jgi:hypothetical protein
MKARILVRLEKSRLRRFFRSISCVFGRKKRGFCGLRWRVATPVRPQVASAFTTEVAVCLNGNY